MSEINMNEIYKRLIAPFPKKAYYPNRIMRDITLVSLKTQYVTERLNEVFGIQGWTFTGSYQDEQGEGLLFHGKLICSVENEKGTIIIEREHVGFAGENFRNLGDAAKAARTDCLSKCASQIGIGNDVYKGLISAEAIKDFSGELDTENNFDQELEEESVNKNQFKKVQEEDVYKLDDNDADYDEEELDNTYNEDEDLNEEDFEKEKSQEKSKRKSLRSVKHFQRSSRLKREE